MPGPVDLHSHTTASDGSLTPRELVREAARRGLRVLAITDHDSTEGLADGLDEAARHRPLVIVPGIEINCDVEGAEVHVLGYHLDYQAEWFQDFCRAQREERRARVVRMTDRLAELGMPVDPAEVFALVQEGSAGRPHVARVMVQPAIRQDRAGGVRQVPRHGPAGPRARARSSPPRRPCGSSAARAAFPSSPIPASPTATR